VPAPATPPEWISPNTDGVIVAVKAVPRSRATRAVGVQDGALRVQIAAPPHQGRSNAALCAYLAGCAGVRPAAVRVRRGSGGARKLIEVDGEPEQLVRNLIEALGPVAGGSA
jgi:uncharacterized protein YggU (UPF0235/DUF167 family)